MEVSRADYIALLDAKRGNDLVKIITGVRRCGKSYLLFTLYRRHLLEQNIPEDHIISLALDDFSNRKYLKAEELYDYVTGHIHDNRHYYILLDEIQMVECFESVLNGFGSGFHCQSRQSPLLYPIGIRTWHTGKDEAGGTIISQYKRFVQKNSHPKVIRHTMA